MSKQKKELAYNSLGTIKRVIENIKKIQEIYHVSEKEVINAMTLVEKQRANDLMEEQNKTLEHILKYLITKD